MAIQYVNTGSSANKGDGDSIRLAFDKINRNFGLLDGSTTDTFTITNLVAGDVTVTGTFLGTSTFENILVLNTATVNKSLYVGSYVDPNLRARDTVGIYSDTDSPRNLDFRLLNNNASGYSALRLTDRATYQSFIFLHQGAGGATTSFNAGENYIYADRPDAINIGKFSDIYFWANENLYYDRSAPNTASVFINKTDGSVSINQDLYLKGLSFSITSSGTAYANGIPVGGTVKISDTVPVDLPLGTLWYDSVDGRMYVDYDGSWVDTNPQLDLLPATTSTLGGVIVDGTTIVINDGVISAITGDPSRLVNDVYIAELTSTGTLALPGPLTVPGTLYQGTAYNGVEYPDTTIRVDMNVDSYVQMIHQNHSPGVDASSDIVVMNDLGTDDGYYLNMGINSSNYSAPTFGIQTPGSGYLFTSDTDLVIGTSGPNTKLLFHAGGTSINDTVVTMDQYAWTFNRKVIVQVSQPSEMVFLSQNTRANVEASAVFTAANDVGDYLKMGVNSSLRINGQVLGGESFIYPSEGAGTTMHIGNKSSINFYANETTGYLEIPTLRLDAATSNSVFDGNAVSHEDLEHDLGQVGHRWNNLYVGSVVMNDQVMTINTAGHLTINGTDVTGGTTTELTPPVSASTGTFWYDPEAGRLYVYFDNAWVDASPAGGGPTTPIVPSFRVNGGGASSTDIGPGTLTDVNYVLDYNQGGYFSTSTGIFTAPRAGIYSVFLNAKTSTSNNVTSQAAVVKNGTSTVCFWEVASTSTVGHMGVSAHAVLAQGDTLQANVVAGLIDFDSNDSWGATLIG